MKKLVTIFYVLVFIISCEGQEGIKNSTIFMEVDKKEVAILFNGQIFPWEIEANDLMFPYTDTFNDVGFVTFKDTIKFQLASMDTLKVAFVLNKRDTIKVNAIGKTKSVTYDDEYIEENNNTYKVFSPEVHELVNICIALTEMGAKDSNMVEMKTDYYKSVMHHFGEFKNHPIIDSLNKNMIESDGDASYAYYYSLRMDACMYSFEEANIVNNSPFLNLDFSQDNYLKKLLPQLLDFSSQSNFRAFYNQNNDYYQGLIDSYYNLVPLDKMWKWIETKFPERYQAYKVYFSPLVEGAHAAQKFSDNDFSESLMFVNAPIISDGWTAKEKEAIFSRIVFTEIDHNYVNPMSDRFPEVGNILNPIKCWNSNESQWYGNSYSTFNEYMTYAIFTLYMYDNFPSKTFEKMNASNIDVMRYGRGFIKYKEFNEFVLNWYKMNPDESMENLYFELFEWIKNEKCE